MFSKKNHESETIGFKEWIFSYKFRWGIISYYNRTILKFDFLTCVLVFYDLMMVPFSMTFGHAVFSEQTIEVLMTITLCIKAIFAVDIVICFRKAYKDSRTGQEVTNPYRIVINYLKFYFWVDLLSAIPFENITDNKVVRYIALVKVLRLLRLQKIINFMNFELKKRAIIRVLFLIITILIINHWVTCYFYYMTHMNWEKLHANINDLPEENVYTTEGGLQRLVWNV